MDRPAHGHDPVSTDPVDSVSPPLEVQEKDWPDIYRQRSVSEPVPPVPIRLRCNNDAMWVPTSHTLVVNHANFVRILTICSNCYALRREAVRIVPSFGHSPRFVAAIWSLSAVVIIYLYVGTLISFLSVPKLRPIIFRLEDLPNSKLQWGVRAGTALDTLFTV